jgi:hypothetical protein
MDQRLRLSKASTNIVDRQSGATLRVYGIDLDDGERLTVSLPASLGAKKTLTIADHLRELADSLEAGAHPVVGEAVARSELLRVGVQIRKAFGNTCDGDESLALLRTCRDYHEAVMEYLRGQARREL